jgi:hypothetical protein
MQLRAILAAGAAALAVAVAAQPASAALITAPTGVTTPFPLLEYFGGGPIAFGSGISWNSTNTTNQGGSVFGYDGGYGFGSNGFSGADLAGVNDSFANWSAVDTMTFTFATPVGSVGGILNWYPDSGDTAIIRAYDSSFNLLDSFTLLLGGVNQVAPNNFYGFQESSANIAHFTLTDGYLAVLGGINTGGPSGAPEPGAWALSILGFLGAGAMLRRRRRVAVT